MLDTTMAAMVELGRSFIDVIFRSRQVQLAVKVE